MTREAAVSVSAIPAAVMPRRATRTLASFWNVVTRDWRSLAGVVPSIRMYLISRRIPLARVSRTLRWCAKTSIFPENLSSSTPWSRSEIRRSIAGSLAGPDRRKSSIRRAFFFAAISLRTISGDWRSSRSMVAYPDSVVDSVTCVSSLTPSQLLLLRLRLALFWLLDSSASSDALARNSSKSDRNSSAKETSSIDTLRCTRRFGGSCVRIEALLRRSMRVARSRV
mmetsp:Transcript_31494/g.102300  ORF Transcript_31494/g.102300 Transcript_31494/m.102300 type:complete len:225 (-) Transcript_31494:1527-2201(-)